MNEIEGGGREEADVVSRGGQRERVREETKNIPYSFHSPPQQSMLLISLFAWVHVKGAILITGHGPSDHCRSQFGFHTEGPPHYSGIL